MWAAAFDVATCSWHAATCSLAEPDAPDRATASACSGANCWTPLCSAASGPVSWEGEESVGRYRGAGAAGACSPLVSGES